MITGRVKHSTGFTLIETLVVLIIIAIVTTIAVLVIDRFGGGRRQRAVVSQLRDLFQAAEVQAVLQPVVLGIYFTPHGYRFYQLTRDIHQKIKWQPLRGGPPSRPNAFGTNITLQLQSVDGVTRVTQKTNQPAISLLPNAAATPFVLAVRSSHSAVVYRLIMSSNGQLTTRVSAS